MAINRNPFDEGSVRREGSGRFGHKRLTEPTTALDVGDEDLAVLIAALADLENDSPLCWWVLFSSLRLPNRKGLILKSKRRKAAAISIAASGLALLPTPAPAGASTTGPCRFAADAANVGVWFTNSSGNNDYWNNQRQWGAYVGRESWLNSNAPVLNYQGATSEGLITVDTSSNQFPNHGVTAWPLACNPLYPGLSVSIWLSNQQQKPSSTWLHVGAHEYGHGLGLDHSGSATVNLMGNGNTWPNSTCSTCVTYRSADDLAGVNGIYK